MKISSIKDPNERRILYHVLQKSRIWCMQNYDYVLDDTQYQHFSSLSIRLKKGEPVSKIIGKRDFWRDTFTTNHKVLDPRADSEIIIESVLRYLPNKNQPYRVLELGVGSGCLLLSLMLEYCNSFAVGVDISWPALQTTMQNCDALQRYPYLINGNWGNAISGNFDIIISNPPYIPSADIMLLDDNVKNYDPKIALDGGDDGLVHYKIIVSQLKKLLCQNGIAFLEIGHDQADAITDIILHNGMTLLGVENDLENRARCVIIKL